MFPNALKMFRNDPLECLWRNEDQASEDVRLPLEPPMVIVRNVVDEFLPGLD